MFSCMHFCLSLALAPSTVMGGSPQAEFGDKRCIIFGGVLVGRWSQAVGKCGWCVVIDFCFWGWKRGDTGFVQFVGGIVIQEKACLMMGVRCGLVRCGKAGRLPYVP